MQSKRKDDQEGTGEGVRETMSNIQPCISIRPGPSTWNQGTVSPVGSFNCENKCL